MLKGIVQKIEALVLLSIFFALISLIPGGTSAVFAQTAGDLQQKIDQRQKDIEQLEREIAAYQKEITALGSQATSLSATIKSLELTQKKLAADIAVTENKISSKNLEIQRLSTQIKGKESSISDDRRIISHSLVLVQQEGDQSLLEVVVGSQSVSNALNAMDQLGSIQGSLVERIRNLEELKTDLEANKKKTEKAKAELQELYSELKSQKQVVVNTTAEKNKLLKETKQSESQYQKMLAQRKAQKEAFEQEVIEYESQLKYVIDPSKLPKSGKGVLTWPLNKIVITQYFGNTEFSTANPQIYNGKGHTGIDFAASIGTPVKSALRGTVVGAGNTDLYSGCYSYGKWIMVKHPNGLSTLYAHLSLINVSKGQTVSTGEVIGYSGNTGYSTGPHLHFGVYATEGVEIAPFTSSKNCKGATIPLADFKAYLNPLSYL